MENLQNTYHYNEHMNCISACMTCAHECLSINNPALQKCIELCFDCADACLLAAKLDERQSSYALSARQLCWDICKACAEECMAMAYKYPHCKTCADSCYTYTQTHLAA